jgi:hypothetical protein
MKFGEKVLKDNYVGTIVIPKGDDQFVFKCQAVLNFDEFDKLCPQPQAPKIMRPGGEEFENVEDTEFKANRTKWAEYRFHWIILTSLKATKDLEWETVDMTNPETWANHQTELSNAGFSDLEQMAIINKITEVSGLDPDKIEEATTAFLAGQARV